MTGDPTYPWQNSSRFPGNPDVFMAKVGGVWTYVWGDIVDVSDADGVPGQNTTNPLSIFSVHALMKINGSYYDPSYGTKFTNLQQWEDQSVAGFVISDLGGKRFMFRQNPTGTDVPSDVISQEKVYSGKSLPTAP